MFMVTVTARPGHTLDEIQRIVDEEIAALQQAPPSDRELQRVINQKESSFLSESQSLLGKAEALQNYYYLTGNPDWANEDLNRYKALSSGDVSTAARHFLHKDKRLVLSVVPAGQTQLAATRPE
jgi:zinc protease